MYVFCLILWFSLLNNVLCSPKVKVNEGVLEGRKCSTENGFEYHSFQGIPYAKPPINELRFKAPLPSEKWNGTRNASKVGNACLSFDAISMKIFGDENCLYLNVYTPCLSDVCQPKLPVIFHIHGGGFIAGSGDTVRNAPDWLIERGVVVVTINYRLGLFGFLSLETHKAPGNAGLKDQVAALRWTNKNIGTFGGDPNNVTISGVSAGAVSVNYLYLTNITKGLFQKAIQISGSALNPWAHLANPKEHAYKLCKSLGHEPANDEDALNFLINVPATDLILGIGIPPISTISADDNMPLRDIIFLPTSEKVFPEEEQFITKSPLDVFKSGEFQKVPLYVGYCDGEGILGIPDARNESVNFGLLNIDFERYIPKEFCLEKKSKQSLEMANDIKKIYYPNTSENSGNILNYIQIKGDTWFKKGINKAIELISNKTDVPIFYYVFTYDGYSDFKIILNLTHFENAMHANDENYIFYSKKFPKHNAGTKKIHLQVMQMVENFIKFGNPTPQTSELISVTWKPVTNSDNLNYLKIDNNLEMLLNPDHQNMKFWDDLQNKYSNCKISTLN